MKANQKTLEGSQHADRDEQFEYINRKAQRYLKQGEPVISVDTKKKELVGDFKNAGREWELKGQPEEVRVHDFEIREPDKGKVAPYGVYGGSNGARVRLWKWELQKLADEIGLEISVCHFPPGTSKWNKIEHRLFSFISQNWQARP